MKLCVDCRHFIPRASMPELSLCGNPLAAGDPHFSLVTGETDHTPPMASGARIEFCPCGPEAKLWEPLKEKAA